MSKLVVLLDDAIKIFDQVEGASSVLRSPEDKVFHKQLCEAITTVKQAREYIYESTMMVKEGR